MKYIYTVFLLLSTTISLAQWTTNTSVNLEVAALNVADLQTATTSDGKTWIAFYNNNAGNYDMRAQLLDINGNKLLGPNGVLVCNLTSGSATFVFNICLDASNNLIIGFQYQETATNVAIVTKVNTDGSLPWGTGGVVIGAGLAPYPAVLTNGETVVAWNDNASSTLQIQKLSTAGDLVWASSVPVTVGASLTTRGQIVANLNGYFTMVFQKKGVGISTTPYAQRYDNNGVAQWASPIQISTFTTSGARYYSILADGDVTYFGYYGSLGSRFYAYVQRLEATPILYWGSSGRPFSTYSTGTDPYQQTINIAHAPGSPYVWAVCTYSNTLQSQYGVYIQKFDASTTGAVLLDPLGKEVYPISANLDTQTGRLSLVNDDPLFISYDLNYKIYAARLNGSGNFVWTGNRVALSATTAGGATPKGRFAFTDLKNDQVVAVWYENRGTEYRAYAQQINSFGVIPVKLVGFQGIRNGNVVNLSWNTSTESNNKGFNVERSADGINFKKLGLVNSKAIGGNSSVNLDYTFTDLQPLQSYNYYRLAQVDLDEKYTYSKTVLVRFDKQGAIFINNIYPTPASAVLHVSVESGIKTNGTLSVIDMSGKTVNLSNINLTRGNNIFDVDVSSLSKGIYFLKINWNNKEIATEKWVKD